MNNTIIVFQIIDKIRFIRFLRDFRNFTLPDAVEIANAFNENTDHFYSISFYDEEENDVKNALDECCLFHLSAETISYRLKIAEEAIRLQDRNEALQKAQKWKESLPTEDQEKIDLLIEDSRCIVNAF
jgi:hypothetical protein